MKRFKIEIYKDGVAVYDRLQKFYVIDASTIQDDLTFTVSKFENKKQRTKYYDAKYIFTVKTPK